MKRNRAVPVLLGFLVSLPAAIFPVAPVFGEEEWGESPFLAERRNTPKLDGAVEGFREETILLQGVLWDSKTPTAIINNQVLSKGDRVGRWEVEEIRKTQVVLSDGSETRVLRAE